MIIVTNFSNQPLDKQGQGQLIKATHSYQFQTIAA